MIVSELIAALEEALASHGDIEVGYHSNPGVGSFAPVETWWLTDVNAWTHDERHKGPPQAERKVIDLYNGNPG